MQCAASLGWGPSTVPPIPRMSRVASALGGGHKIRAFTIHPMWFGKKHNPEEHRYYLLPGQGKSNRRKRQQQLVAAIIVGIIAAAIIGTTMWFMNGPR